MHNDWQREEKMVILLLLRLLLLGRGRTNKDNPLRPSIHITEEEKNIHTLFSPLLILFLLLYEGRNYDDSTALVQHEYRIRVSLAVFCFVGVKEEKRKKKKRTKKRDVKEEEKRGRIQMYSRRNV